MYAIGSNSAKSSAPNSRRCSAAASMRPASSSAHRLAMLIGFLVAFTLAAVGFSFGFLAILDKPVNAEDLSKIKIEVPHIELPPLDLGPLKQQ